MQKLIKIYVLQFQHTGMYDSDTIYIGGWTDSEEEAQKWSSEHSKYEYRTYEEVERI